MFHFICPSDQKGLIYFLVDLLILKLAFSYLNLIYHDFCLLQ